ncbi:uncharacterized protein LOC130419633 isoform X1 [Triplophysa dalaica]|uniref:uncharacterized protein LOC130419633 isoform X1 n=1 Tax=Triplophysa dalaica TaxID=1582913 RepID=UPI0024DFF4DC|nr:uncharacterized protein LOC130419633 isoform X1 [Triplophysa dalaica]
MYPIRFDLLDTPLEGGEHISVDGSCSKPSDGVYLCGYAVISDSGESELEVLEKQIHDLLERQTRLRERKTAMETSRADARKAAVSVRRDCNTPITSTPCVSMHRAQASRTRRAEMNFTPAPAHTRRKAKSRTGAMTSPPPPRPVFEISTRNRFAALCETKSNAVVIGDSIVRNVRASFNEGFSAPTGCTPAALERKFCLTTSQRRYAPFD